MASYVQEWHQSNQLTTASGTVVIGPIDIRQYDKFAMYFKNFATSVAVVHVDLALGAVGSANTLDFVSANTAIIACPSALAASGVTGTHTSAVNNVWGWARVTAHVTATTSARMLLGIGGHRRY